MRVQVPDPALDLLVHRVHPTAGVAVRQGGGPWQPLTWAEAWPRVSTDLRITFNAPAAREQARAAIGQALRSHPGGPVGATVTWEAGAALVHLPDPPPVLRLHAAAFRDDYGLAPLPLHATAARLAADGQSLASTGVGI